MRKILFCGTLALVLGVVLACLAASQFAGPESLLDRCARITCRLAWNLNSMAFLGNASVSNPPPPGTPIPNAIFPIPGPESPVAPPGSEPQRVEAVPDPQIAETIVVSTGDESEAPGVIPAFHERSVEVPPAPSSDKLPPLMPYADEDSVAGGSQDIGAVLGHFVSFIFSVGDSDSPNAPAAGDWFECIGDMLIRAFTEPSATVDEQREPPELRPAAHFEQPSEESAPDPFLPRFREDPYYQQQYPAFPYSEQCPYPHGEQTPRVLPVKPSPQRKQQSLQGAGC